MKKLLSMLLTLVMLFLLAVPAAAELTPPVWQRLGYESLAECLELEVLSAEQYQAIAEKSNQFDAKVYYDDNYGGFYGDADSFMTMMELSDADFYDWMLSEWFADEAYAYFEKNQLDVLLRSVGGVPGQINVMVNGKCLPFPDAVPVITSGRTMIPLRAVMEGLNCEVVYDHPSRTVSVKGEMASFTHHIGTNSIVMDDGTGVTMDVNSYVKNGRTMVPVRFISQALGYDVYWDKRLQTAVVVDKAYAIAEMDKEFTVLNGLMANQKGVDVTKNYELDMDFSGTAKIYDTISGDASYTLSGEISALYHQSSGRMNLQGSLDLSAVAALLKNMAEESGEALSGDLLEMLSDFSFAAITDSSTAYISAPILGYALEEEGYSLPDKFWMKTQLEESAPVEVKEVTTIGALLYETAVIGCGDDTFALYQDLGEISAVFTALMGDDTFTKSGSSYKWHLGKAEMEELMRQMGESEASLVEAGITQFSMDMTLRQNGSADFSMVMAGSDSIAGSTAIRLEMKGSASDTNFDLTGKLQIRNICDIGFSMDASVQESAKAPLAAPPAGELVIDENFPAIPVDVK